MSSQLEAALFNSLKTDIEQGQRDSLMRAREAVAASRVIKPLRKPALLLILGAVVLSVLMVSVGGSGLISQVIAMAVSVAFLLGLAVLLASFIQLGVPIDFQDEFALTVKRYGRDPIKQALVFGVVVALVWPAGAGLILGLDALAAGAGIPFMVIWAFLGMALAAAAFANLIRAFLIYRSYKQDIWEKFLAEVGRKV